MPFTLGLVKIPVTDFARSTAFYRDVLGLTESFAAAEYGWAQYDVGPVPLCVYVVGLGGGNGTPGMDTGVQLRTDDARAAHARLGPHGGPLEVGDDGTLTFDVRDPDGNRLQVAQVATDG